MSGNLWQMKGAFEQLASLLREHWYIMRWSDPSVTNSDWLYFWEGNTGRVVFSGSAARAQVNVAKATSKSEPTTDITDCIGCAFEKKSILQGEETAGAKRTTPLPSVLSSEVC